MREKDRVTVKMWGQSRQRLADLTAIRVFEKAEDLNMTEVFEAEVAKIYNSFKKGDFRLPITVSVGHDRNQVSQHVSKECYSQLVMIKAHLLKQEGRRTTMIRVINSIIAYALEKTQ